MSLRWLLKHGLGAALYVGVLLGFLIHTALYPVTEGVPIQSSPIPEGGVKEERDYSAPDFNSFDLVFVRLDKPKPAKE
jgi:hypothetical protein